MDDLIRKLSEIRSEYNCFNQDEEPYYRALSEAISILSRRADGDTIYRQAAIDAFDAQIWESLNIPISKAIRKAAQETIKQLPSAERHGRWMMHIDDLFPAESTMECDQCHEEQPLECDDKYCPNCGAKIERSKE